MAKSGSAQSSEGQWVLDDIDQSSADIFDPAIWNIESLERDLAVLINARSHHRQRKTIGEVFERYSRFIDPMQHIEMAIVTLEVMLTKARICQCKDPGAA